MDASFDARKYEVEGKQFCYADVSRVRSAAFRCFAKCDDFTIERFAALVKEIAKGDRITEDTLLRLWGIR